MRRIILLTVVCVFAAVSGLMVQWLLPSARTQERAPVVPSGAQGEINDRQLKAFAKVYVAYHMLQHEYEPSLTYSRDPEEREKIQQEANSKLERVLEKEGLTPEAYNEIFAAVNADDELRKKALELIDEERKRS